MTAMVMVLAIIGVVALLTGLCVVVYWMLVAVLWCLLAVLERPRLVVATALLFWLVWVLAKH